MTPAPNGLERQFDLTLATVRPEDSDSERFEKARLVADFVDLLVVRSAVNNGVFRQEDLDIVAGRLLGQVRLATTIEALRTALSSELADPEDLSGIRTLCLRDNRAFVRYLLARLTAWLEVGAGYTDPIVHYLSENQRGPVFQIEHLLADIHDMYVVAVPRLDEFQVMRTRVGTLVLLHASDNARIGGASLADKIIGYKGRKLWAGSLHASSYGRGNAKFKGFIKKHKGGRGGRAALPRSPSHGQYLGGGDRRDLA
jgi:hypothetical protein